MKLLLLISLLFPSISLSYEIIEDELTITNETPKKPDASAVLELSSTTKGFLGVRMTTVQRDAIAAPATGLVIYNLDSLLFETFNGTNWVPVGGVGTSSIINEVGHGRPIGPAVIPVYDNGGIWTDAQADSDLTIATHVIVEVIDTDNFILAKVGKFPIPGHGLTVGSFYYTSESTSGTLTTTEPPVYSNPVVRIRDASTVEVLNYRASKKIPPSAPGAVDSVFGRTGAVTAQSGDYSWGQINKITSSLADITSRDVSLLTGTLFDSQLVASNVTQFEGSINHDNLLGFVNNEHIDWTAAGAGVIDPSNYVDNDTVLSDAQIKTAYENNANTNAFTDTEQLKLSTIEPGATADQTAGEIEGIVNHDNLVGYVPDNHIPHSSITLTAGFGLSGGGDITAGRTFAVDESQLDVTNMLGYTANNNIDHSTVLIDTSDFEDGLIGGGDLTATRTLSVDITSLLSDGVITGNEELMTFDIGANKLVKVTMDDFKTFATGGVAPLVFQGTWDAAANSPVLISSAGTDGHFYVVDTAGPTILDGEGPWNIGDQAIFQGGVWQRVPAAPITVTSVFGRVGAVTAQANDYTWAEVDKTTSDIADITSRSHTDLQDIGVNTHAQIDTHVGDATLHRIINDAGTSAIELWSANKIDMELGGKANTAHTHNLTTDVTNILPIANGGTGSAVQNFVDLTAAQTIAGVKTFTNNVDLQANLLTTGLIDGRDVATDGGKLDGIEALADVTDTANVTAAGAIMFGTDFLDEDNMASDSATQVASQQSIKAYVDTSISGIPSAPVASVHGRVGAVVSANGDYTASQVANVPAGNLTSVDVQAALNELQTDVDGKQDTITGAATTITGLDLTIDRALISDGSGKVAVSAITAAELGNLGGLTGNIQTQLNTKVETASNLGGGGSVGIFKQKTLVDLEFKGLNAGSNKISITDDGVNDEVDIDVVEANISHDNLSGFVAEEHVDHSGVNMIGGIGISGGGTIEANRTFNFDFPSLPISTIEDTDLIPFYDNSATAHARLTRAEVNDNLVLTSAADTTKGYVDDVITVANGLQKNIQNPGANENLQLSPVYGTAANTVAEGNHTHDRDTLNLVTGMVDLFTAGTTALNAIGVVTINLATTETIDATYFSFDAPSDEVTINTAGRYRLKYSTTLECLTSGTDRVNETRMQRAVGAGAFADLTRSNVLTSCDANTGLVSDPDATNHHTNEMTLSMAVGDRVRLQGERTVSSNGNMNFVNSNLILEYLGP